VSFLTKLRKAYHKIIRYEYEKFKKRGKLSEVYSTRKEIMEKLGIDPDILNKLERKGFLIRFDEKRLRSFLIDVAFRASDIRIQYGGTKYVLESNLKLQSRPFLRWDYVVFDDFDEKVEKLKESFLTIIPSRMVNKFFKSLMLAGVKGLSKYQFLSVIEFLTDNKDVIVSAPTAFGKTYIFLIPILLSAIKASLENKKGTAAVIFYPRKSLGSDQMGRLIRLIYYINREFDLNITIGMDDGDVKKRRELKDLDSFRGIKCPIHPEQQLMIKNKKVFCPKCNEFFDFICLTREDFRNKPPMILITNIWAYQYRLTDLTYWKNGYLSQNIQFFVFDEIHAYRSIVAGVLRYFMGLLRSLVSDKARFVLSSATIPKIKDFINDLTGKSLDQFTTLIYDERIHGKDAEKLELYVLLGIHPLTSWETFTHELAIFLSTVNRLRYQKNFQSLIFVDSIRNISRLHTQAREAIKLGDPTDHLLSTIPPEDPFCYWIYNENFKQSESSAKKIDLLRQEIMNNVETHFSDKADRFEIEDRIKSGAIDVVFTTSTLELGVDYDRVSVIVNTGIPFALESIVQRVGRAGRNEDTTLFTSLCIIIVRNNPLEYFYIYKGIDELIDIKKLPKIPVSFSNIFVVFYSALIYALAHLAKSGERVATKKGSTELLELLTNHLEILKDRVVKDLNVTLDLTEMYRKLNGIVRILKDPAIEQKFEWVRLYKERIWLSNELAVFIEEINKVIKEIEGKIGEIREKEKPAFLKEINYLKSQLAEWKKLDLNVISNTIFDVEESIDVLKNRIRSDIHPFYQFKKDLVEFSYKIGKYFEPQIHKITKFGKFRDVGDTEFVSYFRAEEIYKKLSDHPISVIEAIIGFKFMGNEFIDQVVLTGAELYPPTQKKEQFLNSILVRTPPFELITIPFENKEHRDLTKVVGARHFWLIKPTKGFYIYPMHRLYGEINTNKLGKGIVEKFKDIIIPNEINFVDLLTLERPIVVKMKANDGKPLFIKYGSEKTVTAKVNGKYPVHDNIKRLYSMDPSDNLYYIIKQRTLNFLQNLDEELQNKGNKWGLNFRYPSLCLLGYCISVDPFDRECPVKSFCNVPGCDGKKLWTGSTYRRKIFPKFHTNLKVRNLPKTKEPLLFRVGTITYDQLKEEIEFVYDSAVVYLPTRFTDYMLRQIELTPLGYLARTSLAYLSFNAVFIKNLLRSLIEDKSLLELLKFKFFMFEKFKALSSSLDAALQYDKYDSNKVDTKSQAFNEFLENCLIHTIAHLFFIFLVSKKVNVDPGRITYFIDGSNVYILENSKNDGMGFVETIRNEIKQKGELVLVNEFFKWSVEFLTEHEKHVNEYQKILKKDSEISLHKLKDSGIAEKIIKLQNRVRELNKKLGSYVNLEYVDIITYRHILCQESREWEEYEDELSEYILPIVHAEGLPKLCVDGCDECLVFYRGCTNPFAQNYIISKTLALRFLKVMNKGYLSLVGKNLGNFMQNLMERSDKITAKIPYIDDYGFKLLLEQQAKKKKILVITRADNQFLSALSSRGIPTKVGHFHAKMYFFEKDNERIFIHGSINLTRSSFLEKEENLVVIWDLSEVQRMKREIGDNE